MTIHFYLHYSTRPGQALAVCGNHPALGDGDPARALPLTYFNDEYWHGSVDLDPAQTPVVDYHYLLLEHQGADSERTAEGETERRLELGPLAPHAAVQVVDYWNPTDALENTFYTQPFQHIFFKRRDNGAPSPTEPYTHLLRVKAPALQPDEVLCLLGHGPALRAWDTAAPLLLQREGTWWTLRLALRPTDYPLTYKYGVWNTRTARFVRYEDGENRRLYAPERLADSTPLVIHDGFARLPLPSWRAAGVAIPVFSLRSEQSFGVGEFADIRLLADWASGVGLRLLQLLPINDTTATHTWTDSYPYAAISAFALHPIFLNLADLAGAQHANLLEPYERQRRELNALDAVDYETVLRLKWEIIRELFALQRAGWEKDADYRAYFDANQHWLVPYAAFCTLRDHYGTVEFDGWQEHAAYSADLVQKMRAPGSPHAETMALHLFVQYQLHRQLRAATDYAHSLGLAVKGDIPIGIYRYSCDAWVAPELYNMDMQAGAPPDDFAEAGQNWGFPTYNWQRMQADGFAWWRQRFEQMSLYFDAFRIDHILGFFRIWSIPIHAIDGLLGYFVPALPLHEREFIDAGIGFDYDRLCRPYITDDVLEATFGPDAGFVRQTFLAPRRDDGRYDLLPPFQRQREAEAWFDRQKDAAVRENTAMRAGLRQLIANVILFDASAPPPAVAPAKKGRRKTVSAEAATNGPAEHLPVREGIYHFRFGIEKTSSFRALNPYAQQRLKELYNDYFFRRQDEFWRGEAMAKLPALKRATNMLICGEDLGMVPDTVPGVMRDLAILSLEVQRMPKELGASFVDLKRTPYLSVVTSSTHDMSTIRGWWEEDRGVRQRFFNEVLGYHGPAPFYCEPWINRAVIAQHLQAPAMWSIFQLQDLLGSDGELRRENPHDERINVPANPKHYWRYRMNLTLEQLQQAGRFNEELAGMVREAGR